MLPESLVGTEVAGFTIESVVGRGGMGVVYRARDHAGDDVALKLMAPDLVGNEEFRQRFIREARTIIDHPNIVAVRAAGEDKNLLYIAMKLVHGPDLSKILEAEGRLLPSRTARIIDQASRALDEAHVAGLVHRDIKPPNILVEGEGTEQEHVYLSDFGLVKDASSHSSFTSSGSLLGTAHYMSPEQIHGKQVDGRSDVYSLACVAYECLTGSVPFKRSSEVAVLFAHVNDEVPSASEKVPVLGAGVDEVFVKALAKSPENRYLTAGEMSGALSEQLGVTAERAASVWAGSRARLRSLPAPSPTAATPPAGRAGTGSAGWLVAAAATIALLLGGATIRGQDHPVGRAVDRLVDEVTEPFGLNEHAADGADSRGRAWRQERSGNTRQRAADTADVQTWPASSQGVGPGRGGTGLDAPAPSSAAGSRPLDKIVFHVARERWQGFAAIYTMRADGSRTQLLYNSDEEDRDAAWSPDGSMIAFIRGSNIWVIDRTGENARQITPGPGQAREPSWSPDGTKLVYAYALPGTSDWDLYTTSVYGSDAGVGRRLTADPGLDRHPGWSPDGSQIAFTRITRTTHRQVFLVDADGSNPRLAARGVAAEPRWSPDGRRLAYVRLGTTYRIETRDLRIGTVTKLRCHGECAAPAWSPSGDRLLFRDTGPGGSFWHLYVAPVQGRHDPILVAWGVTEDTRGDWR